MLAAPALILLAAVVRPISAVIARADPDGRVAFQELSAQIKADPQRNIYKVTRISNYRGHWIAIVVGEGAAGHNFNRYEIVYNRQSQRLEEISVNLSQQWSRVTDKAIHAVAAEAGTFNDLVRHGAKDTKA